MTKLEKINNSESVDRFYYWLAENKWVKKVQGFETDRNAVGSVVSLKSGTTLVNFDSEYIWKERKMLNDWISGMISRGLA